MTVKLDGTNGLLQNYDYQTPVTGFTYTFTNFNVLFMAPAGTLATGTITMPASPVDGMTVTISSTQQITALTINANTGQSIIAGGAVQLNANTNRVYMYRVANTTWYLQNISAGNVVTSVNGSTGAVTVTVPPSDVQTFNSTGTWTKPSGGQTMARVQVWGGGGGGGRSTFSGGGGGYNEATVPISQLSTQTVTIGAGGAGGTTGVAGTGGETWLTVNSVRFSAFGGSGANNASGYPGSGGGPKGAGGNLVPGAPLMSSGGTPSSAMYIGSPLQLVGCNTLSPVSGVFHGGGGTGNGYAAAGSVYGGGGGGGTGSGIGSAGGGSVYGGAGGVGSTSTGGAGVQPGGGGGGTSSGSAAGGAGAAGACVITSW